MIVSRCSRAFLLWLSIAVLLGGATACFSTTHGRRSNVLEYLYPEGKPATPASLVELELPLSVGLVFVPEKNEYKRAIHGREQQALLEKVREAFLETEEVDRIEVVPDSFVTPGGGFENVRQIRSALGVDLVALISYDQTQFDDPNLASITYWTIVGAYVVPGNENETHTLVHASIFDIESQAMLLNASGESVVEGRVTALDLERSLREDRVSGFHLAVDDLIANLGGALVEFREQAKSGTVRGRGTPAVSLTAAQEGGGGDGFGTGAIGSVELLLGLLVLCAAPALRRRA
jgi:rhombotail lipoprotein